MNLLKMGNESKTLALRDKVFGEFIAFLKQSGIDPDMWSRAQWLDKVWEHFYMRFETFRQEQGTIQRFVGNMTAKQLRDIADGKEKDGVGDDRE